MSEIITEIIITYIHAFFYSQHFYKQHQAKIGNDLSKRLATPWDWTFDRNVKTNKCGCCNESIWLITMKMKIIMKKGSYNW